MLRYQPGDRVVIRSDLRYGRYYMDDDSVSNTAVEGMVRMAGQIVTICQVSSQYMIEEDNREWHWVDGMFSGLADEGELEIDDAEWNSFFSHWGVKK